MNIQREAKASVELRGEGRTFYRLTLCLQPCDGVAVEMVEVERAADGGDDREGRFFKAEFRGIEDFRQFLKLLNFLSVML